MTAKEKLRTLVDDLSEHQATDALAMLERGLDDPLLLKLATAPFDDEPTTAAEEAQIEEARGELARGETVALDELRHELG